MNIAFFSYKGGVGRSLVLASTAMTFAKMYGSRIGLIDADIEAPSLHYLLNIQPDKDQNFVDILLTGIVGAGSIRDRIITMKSSLPGNSAESLGDGEVFLFPSLPDRPAEKKIPKITYDSTTQEVYEDFLDAYSTSVNLDNIFIDCRTGFSVLASMVLNLADAVILVFRIDRQNLYGVKAMVDRAIRRKKKLLLVANLLPDATIATEKLAEFQETIDHRIDVVIPYDERLVFGDIVAPLEFDQSDPVCRAYTRIAKKIYEGDY